MTRTGGRHGQPERTQYPDVIAELEESPPVSALPVAESLFVGTGPDISRAAAEIVVEPGSRFSFGPSILGGGQVPMKSGVPGE